MKRRKTPSRSEVNEAILGCVQQQEGRMPIMVKFGEEFGRRRYAVRYIPTREEGEPLREGSAHTQRQYDALAQIQKEVMAYEAIPPEERQYMSLIDPVRKES